MPKNKTGKPRLSRNKRIERKIQMAQNLNPFIGNHLKKLEAENEQLKNDPNTVVGQLIPQMRDAISQNKRLSVLAAALIEAAGGSVTLTKAALEVFETKVLNIKWTLPEGVENPDTAESFIFTYEAKEQEPSPDQPQVTVTPVEETPIESVSEEEIQRNYVTEELTQEEVEDHEGALRSYLRDAD